MSSGDYLSQEHEARIGAAIRKQKENQPPEWSDQEIKNAYEGGWSLSSSPSDSDPDPDPDDYDLDPPEPQSQEDIARAIRDAIRNALGPYL
jgi:hypothetical protein